MHYRDHDPHFLFEANHSKALLNHIGERRVLSTLRHLCTPVQDLNWFEKKQTGLKEINRFEKI